MFKVKFSSNNQQFQAEFSTSSSPSGPGLPPGGNPGDLLTKKGINDGEAEWIPPTNAVEEDNTRPITSAAVYMEIGNINALLESI